MELHDRHGGRVMWLGQHPDRGEVYRLCRDDRWLGDHSLDALPAAAAYHGLTMAEFGLADHFTCMTVNLADRTCCLRRAETVEVDAASGLIQRRCAPCRQAAAELATADPVAPAPPVAGPAAAAPAFADLPADPGSKEHPLWSDLDEWWLQRQEDRRRSVSLQLRDAVTVIYAACEILSDIGASDSDAERERLLEMVRTRASRLRALLATTAWAGL
ncbi:hypothetical protein ACFFMN_11860 [Planobispora siamensis]|uniref:Uncharacterized protein n=1 Tax=Planobispora siamensis TaxID=936338 RepID=A0A8J3SAU0_9ACTN|nr:hypothetical protein [Planobispora siamensis]GIH89954.1 hypothetical protein Psi01_05840 [Planobispora siamensis]